MSILARAALLAALLPIAALAQEAQNPPQNAETKKIPDDSVEIATPAVSRDGSSPPPSRARTSSAAARTSPAAASA